jgi:hypothetical protein
MNHIVAPDANVVADAIWMRDGTAGRLLDITAE